MKVDLSSSLHNDRHLDENGIVIGEYGFLDGFGFYNTVMYATDKEGRFLITGRKRVRVTTTTRKFPFQFPIRHRAMYIVVIVYNSQTQSGGRGT